MSGTQANVRIWSDVDIFFGDVGTTAPTDVSTGLDAGFTNVGYIDEDGGVEFGSSRNVTDHYAYGPGGVLVRTGVKGEKHTFKFVLLENTPGAQDLINPGGTVNVTGGVATVDQYNYVPNPKAWVIEQTDGEIIERHVVAKGEVVDAVEVGKDEDDGVKMYTVTVTCYGNPYARLVSNDPALVT